MEVPRYVLALRPCLSPPLSRPSACVVRRRVWSGTGTGRPVVPLPFVFTCFKKGFRTLSPTVPSLLHGSSCQCLLKRLSGVTLTLYLTSFSFFGVVDPCLFGSFSVTFRSGLKSSFDLYAFGTSLPVPSKCSHRLSSSYPAYKSFPVLVHSVALFPSFV